MFSLSKDTMKVSLSPHSFVRGAATLMASAALCSALLTVAANAQQSAVQQDQVAPTGDQVKNPVAVFSGLDKITGRTTSFDVYINETVQFGALQVTPRVCLARPNTEAPKTTAFVQVDEITLNRKVRRIFSGWMFADSPALNAVEHPIYDVWLTGCKMSSSVPPPKDYSGPRIEKLPPPPESSSSDAKSGAEAGANEDHDVSSVGVTPMQKPED